MANVITQLKNAKKAAAAAQALSSARKNAILHDAERLLRKQARRIIAANTLDFKRLSADYPHADRLRLDAKRVAGMAGGIRAVAALPDPIGRIIDRRVVRRSGLHITRRTVPLGVLGIIYEARPNVTVEIFSLATKSGNVAVLKGGRDAYRSNAVLVSLLKSVLKKHHADLNIITMLDPFDKKSTEALLSARQYVDVLIPRGSNRLIEFVRDHARLPVIETGAGVCHTFVDRSANLAWASDIVVNAKTRRPSVCNALDTLVVHSAVAKKLLKSLSVRLASGQVVMYADQASYSILQTIYPHALLKHASSKHFGKEFLSLAMSIKVVSNTEAGIDFVKTHTSGHSEAIITANKNTAQKFQDEIDAAAVYVNTSTAFTDGYEFGLGAEIGISTQKLHARGPMALQELTTYKWFVESRGSIRPR